MISLIFELEMDYASNLCTHHAVSRPWSALLRWRPRPAWRSPGCHSGCPEQHALNSVDQPWSHYGRALGTRWRLAEPRRRRQCGSRHLQDSSAILPLTFSEEFSLVRNLRVWGFWRRLHFVYSFFGWVWHWWHLLASILVREPLPLPFSCVLLQVFPLREPLFSFLFLLV